MEATSWSIEFLLPGQPMSEWDSFVDQSPQGSIFCKSWWLDAVSPASYQIIVVRNKGFILAGLPIVKQSRNGQEKIQMPLLTQTLGPVFAPATGEKYQTRISSEMAVLKYMIEAIPKFRTFNISCHPCFTNWLPFYWAGYSQTTRYTYVLDDLTDVAKIWDGMDTTARGKVRKAKKAGIQIVESDDIEAFLALNLKTFERQDKQLPYPVDLVKRINAACAARDARRIYLATDTDKRIHSALFVVFDQNRMYNLMQGGDPKLRSSGANLLAMWHSIEFSSTVTRCYDFEGSMLPNVEPVFRSFGGEQKAYFSISKDNRPKYIRAIAALLNK